MRLSINATLIQFPANPDETELKMTMLDSFYVETVCNGGCGKTRYIGRDTGWTCDGCRIQAEAKARKRTREVFVTGEIPHLWAHKVQPSARNPQGNLYYRDSTIYSYRDSFPIAAHVNGKAKTPGILLTTDTYSSTTNGHIHAVRLAIPSGVPTFNVPHVLSSIERGKYDRATGDWTPYKTPRIIYRHTENLESYATRIDDAISKAAKAIKNADSYRATAESILAEMRNYATFFAIGRVKYPVIPADLTELRKTLKTAERKEAIERREADARKQAENEARELAQVTGWFNASHPEVLAQWDGSLVHARAIALSKRVEEAERARIKQEADALLCVQTWMGEHPEIAANWNGQYRAGVELQTAYNNAERKRKQAQRIVDWNNGIRGVSVSDIYDMPTSLRINPDDNTEVETSRGVVFPVSHARLGLALVKRVMASGKAWHQNGEQCRLGHYRIDSIETNGTVHAGCHVVPFESIERIAAAITACKLCGSFTCDHAQTTEREADHA
jgi:hypothetical protein